MIPSLSRIINTNLLLLCLITSCFSFAQDNEEKIKEIKALSDKSYKSYLEYKSEESLEYAKQGNKIALEIGDSKSIAKTYNQIARAYTIMGKEKEALEYIEKALAEKFALGEPLLHAKLIILKADNHARLGLDEIANKETFEALDLLKNETEPAALLEKASIYYFISKDFYDKKDYNSVIKYENLNGEILKTMDEKKVYPQMNSMYSLKGSAFLETKKFDSAYHYFTKAYELQKKYDKSNLYQVYILLGNYYYQMDDDKKALEFYLKSVENYKILQINDPSMLRVYKNISEIYGTIGEKEKESDYLKKHAETSIEMQQSKAANTNEAVKMILKEEEKKLNAYENKSFLTIGSIVAGTAALIFGLFVWYRKSSKKSEEIISQKEEENQDLKQKVNESFEETVHLAKTNSPEFLARFQEVYPEFIEKLKKLYPEISSEDLRFCALLKLNFSTKDISEYNFVTVRTVQTRKSRLRKKFNIPSDQDIYLWINEL